MRHCHCLITPSRTQEGCIIITLLIPCIDQVRTDLFRINQFFFPLTLLLPELLLLPKQFLQSIQFILERLDFPVYNRTLSQRRTENPSARSTRYAQRYVLWEHFDQIFEFNL